MIKILSKKQHSKLLGKLQQLTEENEKLNKVAETPKFKMIHDILKLEKIMTESQSTHQAQLAKIEIDESIALHKSKKTIADQEVKSQAELVKIEQSVETVAIRKESIKIEISKLEEKLVSLKTEIDFVEEVSSVTNIDEIIEGSMSESIKAKIDKNKIKQKEIIKNGLGFEILSPISWNDNVAQGKAKQKRHGKFLVTAFNAEVDNLIGKTTARNFTSCAKQIEKWFEKVNKSY